MELKIPVELANEILHYLDNSIPKVHTNLEVRVLTNKIMALGKQLEAKSENGDQRKD